MPGTDSAVPVTAGSGTPIDTRLPSSSTDHRQVVVLGDPDVVAGVQAIVNVDPTSQYGAVVRDPNAAVMLTRLGATNEAAPAGDTAASGLNGRLQRIAQSLTSFMALFPAALSSGGNLKVSLEEDNYSTAVSRLSDSISAAIAGDRIMEGLVALTPTRVKISVGASGDQTLQALIALNKIRVVSMVLVSGVASDIYFKSSGGTAIFGDSTNKVQLAAKTPLVLPFNPTGWFETVAGEALLLNGSTAGPYAGAFSYVAVP
jgi:hypothetical protein